LYTTRLAASHDVRTSHRGPEGLRIVCQSVAWAFSALPMPALSGDEVLGEIESRGLDCRVVMVTTVDPDFDIVEMPVDDYLTKPVDGSDLLETVDSMLTRDSYDEQLQEYFSMASKKATLESEKNALELEDHEAYREVSQRVEALREQADETVDELDDFESAFRDFPSG
jgi:DNA-binding response OmpR family regulator